MSAAKTTAEFVNAVANLTDLVGRVERLQHTSQTTIQCPSPEFLYKHPNGQIAQSTLGQGVNTLPSPSKEPRYSRHEEINQARQYFNEQSENRRETLEILKNADPMAKDYYSLIAAADQAGHQYIAAADALIRVLSSF